MRLVLLILMIAGRSVWSAPALTLKEAVKRGLGYSLEVQKAQSEKAQADAEYRLARAKIFPTLALNAKGGTTATAEHYGNGYVDAYSARLNLEQPLFYSGVISAGMKAASLRQEMAASKLRDAKQDYVFKVVEAYYKTAQAQTLLGIAKENREVLKNFWEITSRYARIGRSKGVDRLQAEASYNLSESDVLEAESSLEESRYQLARLLGEESGTTEALAPKLRVEAYDPGALDKLAQEALEKNPSIKATESELESLIQANRAKMVEHRPKLYLKGSYGYDAPDEDVWFMKKGEAYSLTVNLDIPLFSGFSSFAQSDQQNEQRRQKEKDLMIQRQDLRKNLASSLATMKRDFQRLKLTQNSATSSKKAIDIAVRDYRNGLLSPTEVLNIQRTRLDADRKYTAAQYSYNQQILSVRRDIGVDLEKTYED
jgi:outer membrane protein TolC